ncbi:MAG: GNAT family N-acetyltransferase [Candidatus Hydrogenedentes bacterium]|nr:GNAT family N-acetyltransferase [Candidatus Hydrogenedentota bacterium]
MHPPSLQFALPDVRYRASFLSAYEEMSGRERNDWIYLGPDGTEDIIYDRFAEYVSLLCTRETEAPVHFVCGRTYWAIERDRVVGRIGLRFELNTFLANYGGHVGYIVRPSARGRGVAKAMLAHVLTTPQARAIGKLLVTCDEDNVVSERVILANGGVYESTVYPEGRPVGKKRFWITV